MVHCYNFRRVLSILGLDAFRAICAQRQGRRAEGSFQTIVFTACRRALAHLERRRRHDRMATGTVARRRPGALAAALAAVGRVLARILAQSLELRDQRHTDQVALEAEA
jgi:hypothetical protein